jgi:MoaA/NifB/PqqE/SkfB family radical SAM enzyme
LDAEIVCITGGEPMFDPSLVMKILSECQRLAFSQNWLFTNGFWAHNHSKTCEMVKKLKDSGLTKMFFSVDAFHQSYVRIEYVKNAI